MRVVAGLLVIVVLFLGGTGCSLFNKRNKDSNSPASGTKGKEGPKFPTDNDPIKGGTAQNKPYDTMIYGTIVFGDIGRPGDYARPKLAFIRYTDLDDSRKEEAPIDVEAQDGYFTIHGLKPNHHYKLVARAKEAGRMLAGVTEAIAPQRSVLITLKAENVSPETPPIPNPPMFEPKGDGPKKSSQESGAKNTLTQGSWGPDHGLGSSPPGNIPDLPAQVPVPVPVPAPKPLPAVTPAPGGWVPGIANDSSTWPPKVEIKSTPPGFPGESPLPPPSSPPADPGWGRPPVRVPSCVLVGKHLSNFTLYDLNHQPWEFRTHRRGKLVLLDFWFTLCLPCKETIPHLRILQSQYGHAGLQVVGIAYERGAFDDQVAQVGGVCRRLQTNYQILLGGDTPQYPCPVKTQFEVRAFPTLVLVDDNNNIIWRHEGTLNRYQLDGLELLIKRNLGLN